MIVQRIRVTNKLGLHARPSTLLVKTATKFRAELKIRKEEIEVNGKSLLGVLTLAAAYGTEIDLVANGMDEQELIEEIQKLFQDNFGED